MKWCEIYVKIPLSPQIQRIKARKFTFSAFILCICTAPPQAEGDVGANFKEPLTRIFGKSFQMSGRLADSLSKSHNTFAATNKETI